MEKSILILTCVSGFLDKFEKENVKILRKLGFCVHYASNMKEQHYVFDIKEFSELGVIPHHIDIERSPFMIKNNRQALKQILQIIYQENISVLHCHSPVGGMLGRLAGRYCNKRGHKLKVLYTAHGFHFYKGAPLVNNSVYQVAERFLAHYTDVLITINEEDYQNSYHLHLKPGGKRYKLPSVGLDIQRFKPLTEEQRRVQREKLKLEDKFFLVSVGELNENKNHYIVLKALQKMKDSGKDISNIVYGICGDGFLRERLENWIKEMGLTDNVILFGYCIDVRPIEGCADAAVFPSKREGLGMAAIEALSMGIPLIASDNRGTREYMVHKKNGYVCNCADPDTFVAGIEFIKTLDDVSKREIAEFCRKSVGKFDKKYTNDIMTKVYQEVL